LPKGSDAILRINCRLLNYLMADANASLAVLVVDM
jgi:hypothetical protein